MKAIWLFLLAAFLGIPCWAQNMSTAFLSQSKPLVAGSWCRLWLCCMNNSSNEAVHTFDTRLGGSLSAGSNSVAVVLLLNTNASLIQQTIKPGRIVKEQYYLAVPTNFTGLATLNVSNYNAITLVIRGKSSPFQQASPAPPFETISEQIGDYLGMYHFSGYEPIYFILGNPKAEFQFSLRYQLFSFTSQNNVAAFLNHTYVAYTQTSMWVLLVQDPYFFDTSYKPSLFYYSDPITYKSTQFTLQAGSEHESNGRGGTDERSIFTAYLQPTATLNLPDGFSFELQPRVRCYYLVSNNNRDIAQYRGYADLLGSLTWMQPNTEGKGEKIQFATKFRIGDEGSHVGLLFDLRFNFGIVPWLRGVNPTIQLQYFTGYGETLIQYNQKSQAFRAGICLWY